MKKSIISGIILSSWLWIVPLQAATVSLVPQSPTVQEDGGSVFIDLILNDTDAAGSMPGSYAGSVAVTYNNSLVEFSGFVFVPPVIEGSPAVTDIGGQVNLGFINALGQDDPSDILIGTFTFTAKPNTNGNLASFGISDLSPFGSFVNFNPITSEFEPEFFGTDVQVVPVPAAVWLFSSALFGMGAIARKRIAVRTKVIK
ncbi:MAG: hypothetical protein ACR2QG_07670 [Gammaproteobacteria bacterium]